MQKKKSFYDLNLQELILVADEVWIASEWTRADLEYMEMSIENIVQINKNLTIFGSKSFGSISQEWYEQNEFEEWSTLILEESDIDLYKNLFAINSSIEKMVTSLGGNFINTQELICNGQKYCQNYLEGDIISHGGGHLTPYGAKILGYNLKKLLIYN